MHAVATSPDLVIRLVKKNDAEEVPRQFALGTNKIIWGTRKVGAINLGGIINQTQLLSREGRSRRLSCAASRVQSRSGTWLEGDVTLTE
jgi:hypothetical protein